MFRRISCFLFRIKKIRQAENEYEASRRVFTGDGDRLFRIIG
jgi:hypothetical protein